MPGFPNAMPIEGLLGGLLIGLAGAIMLLGLGRIAGVSGLIAAATGLIGKSAATPPQRLAIAFTLGLPLGAFLVDRVGGGVTTNFPLTLWSLIIGGMLVGFGTRLGSGCTSGHGVCGISRLSPRSIVATLIFMASGFATVALLRAGGLL